MTGWLRRGVFVLMLAVAPGAAADGDAFQSAVAGAYGHYREAVFYAKRGNAMSAASELDGMAAAWQAVVTKYRAAPPAAYAKDKRWQASLDDITRRVGAGRDAATAGVEYLLRTQDEDGGWSETEFTGTGFPLVFYLRYHMYPIYFPLLALAGWRNDEANVSRRR